MTEKTNTDTSLEQPSLPLGHFAVGFSLGVVAGAVGYYLFGTSEGRKVTTYLKEEWDDLRKPLSTDTAHENTAVFSPPAWWVELKKTIKEIAGDEPSPKKKTEQAKSKPVPVQKKTPRVTKTPAPKKNTFKGI